MDEISCYNIAWDRKLIMLNNYRGVLGCTVGYTGIYIGVMHFEALI